MWKLQKVTLSLFSVCLEERQNQWWLVARNIDVPSGKVLCGARVANVLGLVAVGVLENGVSYAAGSHHKNIMEPGNS